MRLVNCTAHPIHIADDAGNVVRVIEPSGQVARVAVEQVVVGELDGVPVVETHWGTVEGLPEPQEDVVYVTSTIVLQAAKAEGRTDVVSPDTGPTAVRDEEGRIIAVRRFQR